MHYWTKPLLKNLAAERNIFLSLFLGLLLSSCSTIPINIGTYKMVYAGIFGYEDIQLDSLYIDSLEYSSLKLKIGKGPGGLAILESLVKKNETWVTADGIYVVIKGGRIIATQGVGTNLIDYQSRDLDFFDLLDLDQPHVSQRYVSYDEPQALNVALKITTSKKAMEVISILGYERDLILFEELVENEYISWKVINQFWVDKETGFVWKSVQTYAPNLPPFIMEVTKKPPL